MSSAPRLKLSPRGWSGDPSSYSLAHSLSLCWLLVRHRCGGDVMFEAFSGFIVGVFLTIFAIGGIRSVVDNARMVECQAKLNVTKCVRTIEYVADTGQK